MRKRKAFPDEIYTQAESMKVEGHLDHDIQDFLVRSGQLTEWDAQVLLHEINESRGEIPLHYRNWVIIITCNAIGLILVISTLTYLYSFRNVEIIEMIPVAFAGLLFLAGCVFLEKGVAELITDTKPR